MIIVFSEKIFFLNYWYIYFCIRWNEYYFSIFFYRVFYIKDINKVLNGYDYIVVLNLIWIIYDYRFYFICVLYYIILYVNYIINFYCDILNRLYMCWLILEWKYFFCIISVVRLVCLLWSKRLRFFCFIVVLLCCCKM